MFKHKLVSRTLLIALVLSVNGVDLLGGNASRVGGKVVDKAEHAPISNAYVFVHSNGGSDKSVRTDGNGRYVIELSSNIYDVFISAVGFAPVCRKIEVLQGSMMVFDAVLDVSDVGMQVNVPSEKATPSHVQGIAGDIPGGLPPDGTNPLGGILSSEPGLPHVATPTHIRVAQGVMRSFLITKVSPSYPLEAQRQHVDGSVVLHVNIDKTGNVTDVSTVSGHPLLIPSAMDAVKQWKYKPYLLNQRPVEVETTVLIKFVISGGNVYSVIASVSPPYLLGIKSEIAPTTRFCPRGGECGRVAAMVGGLPREFLGRVYKVFQRITHYGLRTTDHADDWVVGEKSRLRSKLSLQPCAVGVRFLMYAKRNSDNS